MREALGLVLRGFAVLVIAVSAGYFAYALVVTASDRSLAASERASVAAALVLAVAVCLLMLALRLDGALLHGAIARRGLTGRLYVALFVCAVVMMLVALLGGMARVGTMAVLIFPAAIAFGLLGTMSELKAR